jgi:hypothetical protein
MIKFLSIYITRRNNITRSQALKKEHLLFWKEMIIRLKILIALSS